jgi:hypothetical protein
MLQDAEAWIAVPCAEGGLVGRREIEDCEAAELVTTIWAWSQTTPPRNENIEVGSLLRVLCRDGPTRLQNQGEACGRVCGHPTHYGYDGNRTLWAQRAPSF